MTGRPLGRASLPGGGEARLAGTLWTLCGWHAARPCGGGPGACLRGDPRGRRVRCPWGPRARGRTSVRPDPDPGTPRRVTCSRLGPGHTRPVARTMEEGEEGRRPPPQASLSGTRPTREVAGTCRRSPGGPSITGRRLGLRSAVARETRAPGGAPPALPAERPRRTREPAGGGASAAPSLPGLPTPFLPASICPGRTDVGTCGDRLHMLRPIHRHSDAATMGGLCARSLNILICAPRAPGCLIFHQQ